MKTNKKKICFGHEIPLPSLLKLISMHIYKTGMTKTQLKGLAGTDSDEGRKSFRSN